MTRRRKHRRKTSHLKKITKEIAKKCHAYARKFPKGQRREAYGRCIARYLNKKVTVVIALLPQGRR